MELWLVKLLSSAVVLFSFCQGKIKECRVAANGRDYQGSLNRTVGGYTCQAWTSQFPHEHGYTDPRAFPEYSLEEVQNHCRNPDEYSDGAWCFTTDPEVRWDLCDIPKCSDYPECKLTDMGSEYLGSVSVTLSGESCQPWDTLGSAHPELGNITYCRNPDQRSTGPWCYLNTTSGETGSCDIPFCKPSAGCKRTGRGEEYSGSVSWTETGRICQRWDRQSPHAHTYTDAAAFPDSTLDEAGNGCRNPAGDEDAPWCYTTDPDVEREYCQLQMCEDCKTTETERNYFGSVATTTSGFTCQRWDSQSPHPHSFTDPDRFPDASVQSASNFCRNPDGKLDGPWCYTSDPFVEWDYCDIGFCEKFPEDLPLVPIANHVVLIGIDGIRPDCIAGAPGGAPNILQRLGAQGTSTLTRARTVLQTVSSPSWSTFLCGMPVERTGITSNSWVPPWVSSEDYTDITPVTGSNASIPCIYQTIKAQDKSIQAAAIYNWDWIRYMGTKGYPSDIDMEVDCRDGYVYDECDVIVADRSAEYLYNMFNTTEKSFTFIYFAYIDVLGHTYTWCGDEYNDGLDVVDAQVGQILDAIEEAGKADDTVVMMSADHGGLEYSHGRWADSDLMIPLMIKGPGIKVGHEFQNEVGNMDLVPTAARVLGIQPSPWWRGSVLEEAFEDGVLYKPRQNRRPLM